jgi:alanyl aminopeptidase. Metallo peptidase. MEROPS family M01
MSNDTPVTPYTTDTPVPVQLADYAPPPFLIETVHLDVDIRAGETVVTASLSCVRNACVDGKQPLVLDGEELETISVCVDGLRWDPARYRQSESQLVIENVPDAFMLETRVRLRPDSNTQLFGLLSFEGWDFTQCEPQGFRRITWFIDRPDVMARYTVTLHADKAAFPFLLANGNPVASGDEPADRHFATWEDRSANQATCSPWWPASSTCCAIATARLPAGGAAWPSTSNRASSISARTPCLR